MCHSNFYPVLTCNICTYDSVSKILYSIISTLYLCTYYITSLFAYPTLIQVVVGNSEGSWYGIRRKSCTELALYLRDHGTEFNNLPCTEFDKKRDKFTELVTSRKIIIIVQCVAYRGTIKKHSQFFWEFSPALFTCKMSESLELYRVEETKLFLKIPSKGTSKGIFINNNIIQPDL